MLLKSTEGSDLLVSADRGKGRPFCASLPVCHRSSPTVCGTSQGDDSLLGSLSVSSLLPVLLWIQDSGTYTWMTKWPSCSIHGCFSWRSPKIDAIKWRGLWTTGQGGELCWCGVSTRFLLPSCDLWPHAYRKHRKRKLTKMICFSNTLLTWSDIFVMGVLPRSKRNYGGKRL